jgi:hypothetical protein
MSRVWGLIRNAVGMMMKKSPQNNSSPGIRQPLTVYFTARGDADFRNFHACGMGAGFLRGRVDYEHVRGYEKQTGPETINT